MYKKILIVGSPGSGKSTLARKISEKTGHELIHLDNEYWSDTWVATPREEFREKVSKLVEKDCWIMDGNYSNTFDIRLPAADVVIFLDINRFVCLFSVISRHGKARPDIPDGCAEKFDKEFLDFLKYVLSFPKKNRQKILNLLSAYPEKPVITVKTRKQANDLAENCEKILSQKA